MSTKVEDECSENAGDEEDEGSGQAAEELQDQQSRKRHTADGEARKIPVPDLRKQATGIADDVGSLHRDADEDRQLMHYDGDRQTQREAAQHRPRDEVRDAAEPKRSGNEEKNAGKT